MEKYLDSQFHRTLATLRMSEQHAEFTDQLVELFMANEADLLSAIQCIDLDKEATTAAIPNLMNIMWRIATQYGMYRTQSIQDQLQKSTLLQLEWLQDEVFFGVIELDRVQVGNIRSWEKGDILIVQTLRFSTHRPEVLLETDLAPVLSWAMDTINDIAGWCLSQTDYREMVIQARKRIGTELYSSLLAWEIIDNMLEHAIKKCKSYEPRKNKKLEKD